MRTFKEQLGCIFIGGALANLLIRCSSAAHLHVQGVADLLVAVLINVGAILLISTLYDTVKMGVQLRKDVKKLREQMDIK